jgi:lipoteichoic acid synthase
LVPFAVALVLFKLTAAIVLRDAWQLAPSVFDCVALFVLVVIDLKAPRAGRILGALLGLYVVANTGLLAAVGSPLTMTMLAYAGDAAHVVPFVPAAICLGSMAVFVVVAAALLRRGRPLASRAFASVAALAIVAVVLALVRGSWGARDNALSALALSFRARGDAGERVAFDAPLDDVTHEPTPAVKTKGVKHVVIWLAESVGARHAEKAAPALAKLRAEGSLSFTSWTANAPVSAKAIFTTLCGLYPLPEGTFESRALPRIACPSLMEHFTKDAHGRAALFHGGYFAFTDKLALLEERGFDVMMDGESVPDRDRFFTNGWGVDDKALVQHGLAWLDTNVADERTLAVYIPLVPHYEYWLPTGAAKPFGNGGLQQRYLNGVAYTDALFAQLVEGYRARGLLDDTLFVFLGDHGEAFDEHPKN